MGVGKHGLFRYEGEVFGKRGKKAVSVSNHRSDLTWGAGSSPSLTVQTLPNYIHSEGAFSVFMDNGGKDESRSARVLQRYGKP
jgi:hypothetical protein